MNPSKLAQLRSKTDRQLIAVIVRRLDAGCESARRGYYSQAAQAYDEVRVLLPRVDSLTLSERKRLESRLAWLGETLEERTAGTGPRVQTAACL
jgi:hypothetical protein